MKANDLYQQVTDTIIELLEDHQEHNYIRPWILMGQDGDFARNPSTGNYYRGINQLLLSTQLLKRKYLNNTWMTFKQISKLGGKVLKGERSSPIVFYKTAYLNQHKKYVPTARAESMSAEERMGNGIKTIPMLKLYRVFNVTSQTEGLDPKFYKTTPQESLQDFIKDERAEELIKATGAEIEIVESNQAYYDRVADKIRLPLRSQFRGQAEPFYATALHELGHWTGHPTRLDRTFGKAFGDKDYGKEEIVGELTSAFCCAALGFSKTITNNAAYIKSWLGVLKQDNKAIVRAANQAQKAADYILAGTRYEITKPDIG